MKKSDNAPNKYKLFDCYSIQGSVVSVFAIAPESAVNGIENIVEHGAVVEMLITSFEDRINDNK